MKTPKISIIFTSYNHHQFLSRAIDSILNQTYQDFELIIIDDESTDGSQELIKQYEIDNRVKIHLLEKNTGSYVKASNLGVKYSIGEYILFAQCDDYAEIKQLEKLISTIEHYPNCGVVWSSSNLVDGNSEFISNDILDRTSAFRSAIFSNKFISRERLIKLLSNSCIIPNLSAALVKKEFYLKVGGLNENYKVVSDWKFWIDLAFCTNFYYIEEPLNNFRQHNNTIRSKTKIDLQITEIYDVFYFYINSNKLSKKNKYRFRVGAAYFWTSFFYSNTNNYIISFMLLYKKLKKYENNLFFYILISYHKFIYEMLFVKLFKFKLKLWK